MLAAVAAGGACLRGDEAACSQARREERGKREQGMSERMG